MEIPSWMKEAMQNYSQCSNQDSLQVPLHSNVDASSLTAAQMECMDDTVDPDLLPVPHIETNF